MVKRRASGTGQSGPPPSPGGRARPESVRRGLTGPIELATLAGLPEQEVTLLCVKAMQQKTLPVQLVSMTPGTEPDVVNHKLELAESQSAEALTVDPNFDPWTAGFASALASGPESSELRAWIAARVIEHHRAAIEADGSQLLSAIGFVMKNRLRPPAWLAQAYLARMTPFEKFECRTLDDAFDFHPPTMREFEKQKRRSRSSADQVHQELLNAVRAQPTRPLDESLFEEVGEKFGIGKTTCQEIYFTAVKQYGMQDLAQLKQVLKPTKSTRRS